MTQEIKTDKFEGLLVKTPEWYVSSFVNMGYLVMKVQNEDNFISTAAIENPYKLQKALAKHNPSKDYKDIPIKLPDGEWKLIGNPFEVADIDCIEIVGPDNPGQEFNKLLNYLEVYSHKPECANPWCNNGKIDCGYNEFMNCFICEEAEERTGNWVLIQKIG